MTLAILREDALTADGEGSALRLSLPWIRSLPLACLRGLRLEVDGSPVDDLRIRLADGDLAPQELEGVDRWWFVQDRIVLVGLRALNPGAHLLVVSFTLLIPYLPGGPDTPLTLPFREERACAVDVRLPRPDVSRDAA